MPSLAVQWILWAIPVGCWLAFGVVWIGGAIYNAVRAPTVVRRGTWSWQVWVLVVGGAFLLSLLLPKGIWKLVIAHTIWLELLGCLILLASTIFTLWARFVLGTMWTMNAAAKAGHVLHTDGPYAITRHPIYTGLLGMILGTVLLSGLAISFVFLAAAVIAIEVKLHAEETLLTATLGEQYLRYKARVPQLIPGLYRLSQALLHTPPVA